VKVKGHSLKAAVDLKVVLAFSTSASKTLVTPHLLILSMLSTYAHSSATESAPVYLSLAPKRNPP
jgi:hypothetical protein